MYEFFTAKNQSLNVDVLFKKIWNEENTDLNKIRVNLSGIKKLFGDIFHFDRDSKIYSIKKNTNFCIILEN